MLNLYYSNSSFDNCDNAICEYISQFCINSLCVPIPTIFPSSNTIIWSAFKIVLILCATIITVLSFVISDNAALKEASVFKSSAEKLSSNIYISGSLAIALAIDNLCFCPPETLFPPL